jgi:hypothetical protein
MKIIYELDSDNPDQHQDIEIMHNAQKYWSMLWKIDQKIRSWQKHGDDRKYETAAALLDEVRNMISETDAIHI